MDGKHPQFISLALYRLSWLSFIACVAGLLSAGLMGLALTQQPPTLVAVDDHGRLHGYIEYLNPSMRSNQEIEVAIRQFVSAYLSVNSSSIVTDLKLALSMMAPKLAEQEKQVLIQTNKIATIEKKGLSSYVRIDAIDLQRRTNHIVQASIKGKIHVARAHKSFSILVQAKIVPRTIHNTFGVQVIDIKDIP